MANRIRIGAIEAERDDAGVWQCPDAPPIAELLNMTCGVSILSGADPDHAAVQLQCAVDNFNAVILEADPPPPTVPDRVY